MTEILNIGRLLDVDKEGFIVSESDFAKIKSPWKEACLEIKEAYIENLKGSIHSIYVRGTVSRGEAIEGISDIDTFAVLNREVQKEDRLWFRDTLKILEEEYSFATDIELNLLNIHDVLDEEKGFNDRFTIKVQSVCLYGEDLTLTIPPFKPSLQTASHFHRDLGVLFDKLKLNITKDFNTEKDIQEWCRWIMKRIIFSDF